jgi:hypothetical protein
MSHKVTYDPGAFNPMVQSFQSKIDLPTPNPTLMYCIKKIENFPELGYCYLTVLVERAGEPYQTILFYTYVSSNADYRYSRFIEGIKTLVPLHSTRIKEDCLIVDGHKSPWEGAGEAWRATIKALPSQPHRPRPYGRATILANGEATCAKPCAHD